MRRDIPVNRVIPPQAGISVCDADAVNRDSRLRGNDSVRRTIPVAALLPIPRHNLIHDTEIPT